MYIYLFMLKICRVGLHTNSAIFISLLSALCACIHMKKMALQIYEALSDQFQVPGDTTKF